MKIKYIISSHIDYYITTLPKLITSLTQAGIEKEDIFFVIGGEGNNVINFYNVNGWINVDNSFDLTSLIEVVKLDLYKDYNFFFLLHDTCSVEQGFKEKVESYINENTVTIGLWSDYMSSNIGLYKRDFLFENEAKLLSLENKTKMDYVKEEDYFLKAHPYNKQFFGKTTQILGYEPIYNDDTIREINYCEEIGLFKYKANWKIQEWVVKP